MITFSGFDADRLAALQVAGVGARWAAVQERLHPPLAALADAIRQAAAQRLPRIWPLYEISFSSRRSMARGASRRSPADEYFFVIDRPPRGASIYVAVSGAERRILVTLQVGQRCKPHFRQIWETQRPIWLELAASLTDVRFAGSRALPDVREPVGRIEQYLTNRRAAHLLAGFSYRWDDPLIHTPTFAERVVEHTLALLPLLEAILEQAEAPELRGAHALREQRAGYTAPELPAIETIIERIHARGLAIPEATLRAYHLALQTRPLVILPGVSGTGKTRLTRLYADAMFGEFLPPGDENDHYLLVAVQPDWHNARDLLGFYNAITGRYHATPFLRFLMRAATDPLLPYYVCLDELNLARPEYYLAPLLSALETDDRLVDLGAPGPLVETVTGEQLPNPFRLPLNVRLTGTVNVDESTHQLSDKVLDRANVIELNDIDLGAFQATYRGTVDAAVWARLVQLHAVLARGGQPFGYRTLASMLEYLEHARDVLPLQQALDQQIKQKLLPKLRGEDTPRLRRTLTELLELLSGLPQRIWGRAAQMTPEQIADAPFPDSAEKIRRMLERLDADGFTDFYG